MDDRHVQVLTHAADTISAGAILGAIIGVFPPIAALAATIWYSVQIWESHTVQKWVRLHMRGRRTVRPLKRHKLQRKLGKGIVDAANYEAKRATPF